MEPLTLRATCRDPPVARGLMVLISALLFFFGVRTLVKAASVDQPSEMIFPPRNTGAMVFLVPRLFLSQRNLSLKTSIPQFHLLRAGGSLGAMCRFFFVLKLLRLADAMLLCYTLSSLRAPII